MDEKTRKALTAQYLQACEQAWSTERVGDAEFPLTNVFVMLQAIASPPPRPLEKRPDLLAISERWEDAGIKADEEEKAARSEPPPLPVPLSKALAEAQHMTLLGEPGAGKSTALKFIGLCFAQTGWAAERLNLLENRIPIRLELSAFAGDLCQTDHTLEDCLANAVNGVIDNALAAELVRYWRDSGQLLVLLDGLDEVQETQRPAVRQKIVDFTFRDRMGECRLVVSSRIAGFVSMGSSLKEFTLKPFQKAEEAQPYLKCWLEALQSISEKEAGERADELLAKMQAQPALQRVLDNPLLLRLAAEVFVEKGEIARNRADLYMRWVENTWKRAVLRGADPRQKDAVMKMLEDIAWGMQTGKEILPERDISLLREQIGLVILVGDRLTFSHTTIREYFVSQRLQRAWRENQEGAWYFLKPRLHLPEWREPLLLMDGGLNQNEASDLIRRVLHAQSVLEHPLRRDLSLVVMLVGERAQIEKGVREEILHDCRRLLLSKRNLITERRCSEEALGEVGGAEAAAVLREALKDEDTYVRRAAAYALGKAGGAEAAAVLREALKNEDRDVRRAAAYALGEVGGVEAAASLRKALKNGNTEVRPAAAYALGKVGGAEAAASLREALKDGNTEVRQAAAKALGEVGGAEAAAALREALKDENTDVRRTAAYAQGEVGGVEAAASLREALKDEDTYVRWIAAKALGEAGGAEAAASLWEALKDKDRGVRWAAEEALGKILANLTVPFTDLEVRNQITLVRKIVKIVGIKSDLVTPAAQYLDALQARLSLYQDPFQKPEPPFLLRSWRKTRFGLAIFLLLGIGTSLALFSDVLKEVLKVDTLIAYRTWIEAHLFVALGGYIVLGVLAVLIGWWVDSLRKRGKTQNG